MRFLLSISLIAVLGWILEYITGYWWMAAVVAFAVAMVFRYQGGSAFLVGLLGVTISWLVVALVANIRNESILSARMAELMGLPHSMLFIFAAALIGGLVGGVSGWSGAMVRRVFVKS